jgi:hypothetical protein
MGSEYSQTAKAKSFQTLNPNNSLKSAYKASFQQFSQQSHKSFTQFAQNQGYNQTASVQQQNSYQQQQPQPQQQQQQQRQPAQQRFADKSKRFSQYSQPQYSHTPISRSPQSISTHNLNLPDHYTQKTMSMIQQSNDQSSLMNSHYFTLPNLPDESLKFETNFKSDTNIYQVCHFFPVYIYQIKCLAMVNRAAQ